MSKLLYKAAKNGDINQVKAIIATGNININYFSSAQAKRVIDIAAESGHIDIVKYLFEQGAQLAVEATQVGYDFLYCICLCADITQRYELLQWLLSEDRYKTLGDNITIEHIKAALKEPYEAIPIAHAGLLPEHYAALVGSKHFNTSKLNKLIISGFFQGITSAYLLSYSKQYELLKQLAAQSNEKLDLNASPICNNHPEQGTTLAWRLASNEQWELLKQLSQNSIAIDLNAAPTHKNDIYIGTTVAWLLAHHKQWQLFEKLTKNLGEQFDLDARPMHGNNRLKGITIIWWLIWCKQWELLKELLKHSNAIDLNTAPTHENNGLKGMTGAWMLAFHDQAELLAELSKHSASIDLNAAPTHENEMAKGITLAWVLVRHRHWALLKELLKSSNAIDLNALPLHHEHPKAGKTLIALLVETNQWDILGNLLEEVCKNDDQNFTELEKLFAVNSKNHDITGMISLSKLKCLELRLHALLTNKLSEELKNLLKLFFKEVSLVTADSIFYWHVQEVKRAVLAELGAQSTEVIQWVIAELLQSEINDLNVGLYKLTEASNNLRLLTFSAAQDAGDQHYSFILFKEILSKLEQTTERLNQTMQENEQLKQIIEKNTKFEQQTLILGKRERASEDTDTYTTSTDAHNNAPTTKKIKLSEEAQITFFSLPENKDIQSTSTDNTETDKSKYIREHKF